MSTTEYNGAYKGEVISLLKQAISGLKSCKSVSIDIPSDFEAAGTLRNALNVLKGIDIKGAVSEIKSASADFERAENELNRYLGSFLDLFQIGDKNESVKSTKKQLEETQRLLNRNLEKQQKATRKNKKTAWDKLLENNLKKSEKSTKIANQAIAKEQQRIQEKTRRVQASAQNTLVATGKGLTKMGENISDFIALRTEKMQENHLRTIYSSNIQYKEMYGEQYEKEIEQMREDTMSNVEKDYTEAIFNKMYEENTTLKEINEKAYSPFKTTGLAYKIGEQVAPAIVATGAMVVAPEAAPTIVPIIIGMNSGGRASEEYLHDKKMNSREGIEQAYKDGQITKEEYDSYKYIWNLSAEEFSIAMNDMENQEDRDRLLQTYFMSDKWTKEENRDEAITYGNAVGAWDAAQYALGMNLFKFNPSNSALLNSSMRVGVDTGLNASDTPYKAFVRSAIDKDTDFETEFKKLGGWGAVGTSAALGFAGSVLGELGTNLKASKEANQIYEMHRVDNIYDEIKSDLKKDIIGGKLSADDIDSEDFFINYAKSKGYSNKNIEDWVKDHYDKIGGYGIDQGIYNEHMWYENINGEKYHRNSQKVRKLFGKGEGKNLQVKYDDFYIKKINDIANKYGVDYTTAKQMLNIMDTPGGMCSFSSSAESIAYQYADVPEAFKKQFGFSLYRSEGGISDDLYFDYFINSNSYNADVSFDSQVIKKKYTDSGEEVLVGIDIDETYNDEVGVYSIKDGYKVFASLARENIKKDASYRTLERYLSEKNVSDNFELKNVYGTPYFLPTRGSVDDVIDAINNGASVNLSVNTYFKNNGEQLRLKLKNIDKSGFDGSCTNHAMNVLGVKKDKIIVSTWGNIYSIDLKELVEKAFFGFAAIKRK